MLRLCLEYLGSSWIHVGSVLDPSMAYCELCGRKSKPKGAEVDLTLAPGDKDTWLCQNIIVTVGATYCSNGPLKNWTLEIARTFNFDM